MAIPTFLSPALTLLHTRALLFLYPYPPPAIHSTFARHMGRSQKRATHFHDMSGIVFQMHEIWADLTKSYAYIITAVFIYIFICMYIFMYMYVKCTVHVRILQRATRTS